jgi:hypothetical protein
MRESPPCESNTESAPAPVGCTCDVKQPTWTVHTVSRASQARVRHAPTLSSCCCATPVQRWSSTRSKRCWAGAPSARCALAWDSLRVVCSRNPKTFNLAAISTSCMQSGLRRCGTFTSTPGCIDALAMIAGDAGCDNVGGVAGGIGATQQRPGEASAEESGHWTGRVC